MSRVTRTTTRTVEVTEEVDVCDYRGKEAELPTEGGWHSGPREWFLLFTPAARAKALENPGIAWPVETLCSRACLVQFAQEKIPVESDGWPYG